MTRIVKNIVLTAVLAVTSVFTSCDDFLDESVKGYQVLNNYFAIEEECKKSLWACYYSLSPDDWWENDFFYLVGDICSDDAFKGNSIKGDQADFGNLANFRIYPQNEWLEIKWRYMFEMVYRCNLVIENVPKAPVSDNLKSSLVAEAKFLRAFAYFELVKNFGDVPLITEVITANDSKVARTEVAKVWEQIEKDFDEASKVLPEKSTLKAEDAGRATRGAALAFLAKAQVYQKKWFDAQATAQLVIESNEYNLNDPFNKVWNIHNPNGQGSIFEIQNSYNELYNVGNALPAVTGSRADGGWGFCTPSSHLDKFMEGDPRREWTIINQGDNVDADHTSFDTDIKSNESGRTNRKYYLSKADRAESEQHKKSALNHILMRYADLLLLHAEAAYHNNDEASAKKSLNAVRNRVGLAAKTSTGTDLLQDIYNERRMELAMEGHRYYDLKRRNGIKQPSAPYIKEVMEEFTDYNMNKSTDPYDAGNDKGVLFDAKVHILFPIPSKEIDLSEGALTQNYGY